MTNDFEFRWTWRSLAAIVYLGICVFDLVLMPLYREHTYTKLTPTQMVALSGQIADPAARVQALQILKEDRTWTPLTDEMFHLSFGAILGVSALPTNRRGSGFVRNRKRKKNPLFDQPEDSNEETPEEELAEEPDAPSVVGKFD